MTSIEKDSILQQRFEKRGIALTCHQAHIFRLAELTLQRWAEQECGAGNDFASWSIERDEVTNKPFKCIYPHTGKMRKYAVNDREAGALKRIAKLCKDLGLYFFHQTDPRGCTLYVSNQPLDSNRYTDGVACSV